MFAIDIRYSEKSLPIFFVIPAPHANAVPALVQNLLDGIANPDFALLLLAVGIVGVYIEFSRPGLVLPGVLGATLAISALSALAMFPFTLPGALLIIFALCLFVLEALFPTRAILMLAGIGAMVEGALLLIDTEKSASGIHLAVALAVTIPFALITTFLVSIAIRARRNKALICSDVSARRAGPAR